MHNYIIANRGNLTSTRNRQFRACMKAQKPFVTVINARRYASVELDLFTTTGKFNDRTQARIDDLLHQVSEPGAIVRIGMLSCSTSKVRIDIAEKLAGLLYSIGLVAAA